MGLDIAFNREAALNAGLVTKRERNGSDEQIAIAGAEAENHGVDDSDYIAWLGEEQDLILVPGRNVWIADNGIDEIIVRANRWGDSYEPLTQWLEANNIEWSEF